MAKELAPLQSPPSRQHMGERLPQKLTAEAKVRYAEFLPEHQAVIERHHSPLFRALIYVLTALVVGAFAYISIVEVDQVATGAGVVRPDGRVKVVNHPQGGSVSSIAVREGEQVSQGQVLLELDPEIIGQEAEMRRVEAATLELTVIRLEAEAAGVAPVFPADLSAAQPELVAAQMELYNARQQSLVERRQAADQAVNQQKEIIAGLENAVEQQKIGLDLLRQQAESLRKLKEQGYFPELRYLSVLRDLSEAEGQLAQTQARLEQAKASLAQAESERASVDNEFQSQVQAELSDALSKRDQARAAMEQSTAALNNLVILSPADGIVQELKVNNIGQAVGPNQELMKIVPVGDSLIIETKVTNADIGKIELGMPARVKITTYNFSRYGVLEGEVVQISPDSVPEQRTGQLFFSVMVRTNKTYLGDDPNQLQVTPGMTAEVDLVIGRRTILSYLTDRFRQTAEEAFSEN